MKIKKFLHTRLRISDMEQSLAFYHVLLGFEIIEQKMSPRGSHLAFLKVPNSDALIELCSFQASGPVNIEADFVHLAFEVEDMDKTIKELKSKNIPITDGPTATDSGDCFLFIDAPDGYEIELIQKSMN